MLIGLPEIFVILIILALLALFRSGDEVNYQFLKISI